MGISSDRLVCICENISLDRIEFLVPEGFFSTDPSLAKIFNEPCEIPSHLSGINIQFVPASLFEIIPKSEWGDNGSTVRLSSFKAAVAEQKFSLPGVNGAITFFSSKDK